MFPVTDLASARASLLNSAAKMSGIINGPVGGPTSEVETEAGALKTFARLQADVVFAADAATGGTGGLSAQAAADQLHGKTFLVPAGQTVTVAVPSQQATIQLALAAIAKWQAQQGAIIQIVVAKAAAAYVYMTSIIFDHPFGRQIQIMASAGGTSYSFSSLVSITSNSSGNHEVVLQLSSVTGLSVGRYLRCINPIGTGHYRNLAGFWKVTNIAGNNVTLLNTDQRATFGAATLSAISLMMPPVQINFSAFSVVGEFFGLEVRKDLGTQALIGWDQIALVGDGTTNASNGVGVLDGVSLSVGDGRTTAGLCVANWKRNGIWVFRQSQITATGLVSSGNGANGVNCILGGQADVTTAVATGNVAQGFASVDYSLVNAASSMGAGNTNNFYSNTGSHIVATNAKSGAALTVGFYALNSGSMDASTSSSTGTTNSYYAGPGGRIYAQGATSDQSAPTDFYPPLNVMGPQGRLIWTASSAPSYLQSALTVVAAHTFGSLAAGASATVDVTLTGVDTSYVASVGAINGITAGFAVRADVTGANNVRLTATNISGSTAALPATNWRIAAVKIG